MTTYGKHLVSTNHEFGRALVNNWHHFVALQQLMEPTRQEWHPCGSYLMGPGSMNYDASMWSKQVLLFDSCKGKQDILEIGVHGGHSLLIALLANPHARIIAVDTCQYSHTRPCVEYLQSQFPGRIQLCVGSSRDVLPSMKTEFDMIHVDGDHSYEGAKADMVDAHRLSKQNTLFVFDDYSHGIARAVNDLGLFKVVSIPGCAWSNCLAVKTS